MSHIARDWTEFEVVPGNRLRELKDSEGRHDWYDIPNSGWGAMIAWLAGPSRVFRVEGQGQVVVRETIVDGDTGATTTREVPATSSDLWSIDRDRDVYLAEANIPPMPSGYTWYLRLDDKQSSAAFESAVNQAYVACGGRAAVRPSEVRAVLAEALGSILNRKR